MEYSPINDRIGQIKSKYANALVLFRVDEFYVAFNKDALILADLLALKKTITAKWISVGFQYSFLDGYLSVLLKAVYKVAIVNDVVIDNFKHKTTPMKKKTTAKRKPTAQAKKFGQKAKRANEIAFLTAYRDGKEGKRPRTPSAYHKEAAKRVWK